MKLTTIVAIDIARYSALAQADEEAAVAAVARLHRRCVKAVADHDGRIFSTAGDAVMMEFSSVSGGLEAAAQLAADPDPPIRVGVHLGEVSVQENGDLLGHGVNVAARLQAQAKVGGVLVSEDARRALRGALAKRLVGKGLVKLSKIDESIGVYELGDEGQTAAPAIAPSSISAGGLSALARSRSTVLIGAGVGAVLLVAAGWMLSQPREPPAPRVAVAAIDAPAGDPALAALAQGIGEDVRLTLNALGVQTVSADEAGSGGVLLALDGAVQRTDGGIRAALTITRGGDRASLWSTVAEMPAERSAGLRTRTAEESADVLSCGVRALRRYSSLDTQALAGFLRGCRLMRESPLEARDALIEVVERTPGFALARGVLAIVSILGSESAPEDRRAVMREEAREHAERAIRQDPSVGEGYLALSLLEDDWAEHERLLRQALDHDQHNAHAHNFYASFLSQTGRIAEALTYAERSATLDPLSLPKRRTVSHLLLLNNEPERSRRILDDLAKSWPDDAMLWRARARAALWSGDYAGVLALLNEPAAPAGSARLCWRDIARALQNGAVSAQARLRVRDCGSRDFPTDLVISTLTAMGDLDGAFEFGSGDGVQATIFAAYAPVGAPLRADPRFIPLMRDAGLLAYWRDSRHWPDFCREPGLPYQCEAEAERLL